MTLFRPQSNPPDRFHDDAEKSWALPSRYYLDADIAAQEKDAIFADSWQYVCHAENVAAAGQYFTRDIAGESILIMRGGDGELRAFYNVCSHRAHQLLQGAGELGGGNIVCPYHGWAYATQGQLISARGSERVANFDADRGKLCLKQVQVEVFANFIFVNLNPNAQPLHEQLPGVEDALRSFSPELDFLTLAHTRQYDIKANWKNIMENYAECYHCPVAHPSFAAGVVDMNSYRVKTHRAHHAHTSRSKPPDEGDYKIDAGATARATEFGSWFIWPNFAIEVYPGGHLNLFHCMPTGAGASTQTIEWYFPDAEPTPAQAEVIDYLHRSVRMEDVALCESVQRGLASRAYHQGRLIVDPARSDASEHSVHHFQSLIRRALNVG